MKYLLTGNEMAAADRITSEKIGIPSIVLMERAALAAADEITERFAGIKRVTIVSGPGNNGADGLAVGRILVDRGCRVQFFVLSEKDPPAGSSMEVQRKILRAYGAVPEVFDEERLKRFAPEIIVDALFGTGLARELSGTAKQVVCAVNEYRMQNGCKAVAVDIPSGISSETGAVMGCAMTCDLTVTFAYYKRGHFLYPGCSYCGETVLRQIGIHDRSFAAEERPLPEMFMNEYADIARRIAYRDPGGHKGTFGKILIIAGSYAMCGAALLCARAALKSGAGMVKIFTREENRVIIQQAFPEAMLTTYEALPEDGELRKAAQKKIVQALKADIQWADAVAAGPGIGRGSEAALLVSTVLEAAGNNNTGLMESGNAISMLVLDADALFMIASDAAMERQLADHAEALHILGVGACEAVEDEDFLAAFEVLPLRVERDLLFQDVLVLFLDRKRLGIPLLSHDIIDDGLAVLDAFDEVRLRDIDFLPRGVMRVLVLVVSRVPQEHHACDADDEDDDANDCQLEFRLRFRIHFIFRPFSESRS